MSVSKTARLDIYIKERSVALISLAEPGSRPPAAWGGGVLLLWRWFTLNGLRVAGASQVHVFPNLKSADAGQSSLWMKQVCPVAQLQHLVYT